MFSIYLAKGRQIKWIDFVTRNLFLLCLLFPSYIKAQPTGATINNPIEIGSYGQGTYSYSDTKNNSTSNNFQNNMGQNSDDIYYRVTVQGTTTFDLSLCSSTFDTYLYLLDNTGAIIESNDDNGPFCSGLRSSIQKTVNAGIYYIVTEGYSTYFGNLILSVNFTVQASQPDSRNFIRTWIATAPEAAGNSLITKDVREVKQSTAFLDGLGRTEQIVTKKGSLRFNNVPTDLVSPIVYDNYGRESIKYLGYSATTGDGLFKDNALVDQASFYNSNLSPIYGQGESNFYSQTNFESSPLNRVEKTLAPGINWVGAGKGVEIKYWLNTSTDDVKIWRVTDVAGGWGNYNLASPTSVYSNGTLYKDVTIDEHGKQVIEFYDKEGRLILKKAQLTDAAYDNGDGKDYTGWLCTYYIYDNLNNLRCVIQPEGVKNLAGPANWDLMNYSSGIILNEQCFRYEYDESNRMVMKKLPGAGEVWMVYDSRNRLVLTQDANLRTSSPQKWMYILYDNLNRSVETGLWINSQDRAYHKGQASSVIPYPNLSGQTFEQLSITGYDDYTTLPVASSLSKDFDNSFSQHFNVNYNSSPNYPQQQTQSFQTKGVVTWTQIKVLGTSTWLYTVNIYDDKGRVLQVKSKNQTGGTDINTVQYNWAGQPLVTASKTENGGNAEIMTVVTQMSYDDLGRVVTIEKKQSNSAVPINGQMGAMSAYTTIATMEYDAFGQLKKNKIGSKKDPSTGTYYTTRQALEELNYEYNIRGWMLGVNRDYIKEISTTNWFGFDLGYDKNGTWGTFTPQYNGNISGTIWKSKGDGEKRKYDFTYDGVNRLLKANFNQYVSGSGSGALFDKSANVDFTSQMGDGTNPSTAYDANGNIQSMKQWGLKLASSSVIDEVAYLYKNSGSSNKLLAVTESAAINTINNKLGDFTDLNRSPDDYDYDVNGNLIYDKNKNISSITYNHLNHPSVITTAKGTNTYTYDAGGNKLKKITFESGATVRYNDIDYITDITTTTNYIAGVVYESKSYTNGTLNTALGYTDRLQFVSHEEGRIRFKPAEGSISASLEHDYFIKDHLGNVRMVLTEEIKQDPYPASTLEGSITQGASSSVNYEKRFYTISNSYLVDKPWTNTNLDYANNNGNPPFNPSYPPNTTPSSTTTSAKVYMLNATTNKIGLGIVIKVMAGDKIDIHGKSYYEGTNTYNNSNSSTLSLTDIISAFTGSPDNSGFGTKGITPGTMEGINTGLIPLTFLRGNDGTSSSAPKAYINYLFFDEQFKYAGGNFSRVGNSGQIKSHWYSDAQLQGIPVPKNGYLYVYVSNESNTNVFFDNLQVFHTRGALLEETHYYPFGLTMAGISAKALNFGSIEAKQKFVGQELDEEMDINWYQFAYRNHDPQIGRFLQVDPLSDDYVHNSPYAYAENRVINGVDLEGLEYYYSSDGRFLGNIGTSQEVWRADRLQSQEVDCGDGTKGWELKPVNPVNLNITHNKFQKSANVVLQEGLSQDSKEYLWVAHTNNNNANAQKTTFSDLILSDYSSVKDKSPLSDKIKLKKNNKKYYDRTNYARAAVIDVLSGNPDPTGAAMFWDGIDFLAWGWNSPNGTSQNKMEEYKSITISKTIYDEFLKGAKLAYPKGYNYNTAKKGQPKKYFHSDIPNCVFELPEYWTNGYFYYNVGLKKPFRIEATGTAGNTIFWKAIK